MNNQEIIIRWLGKQDYQSCWDAMRSFTDQRNEHTQDEIWLLEHPPVFTQGQNGKPEHILQPGNIPVVQIDRGGQVTYHGPGQLVLYTLLDIQRKKLNIRQLVTALEQSVIQFLLEMNILAATKNKAPGVYVEDKKICSIGLRIRRGRSYHGLAFNIAMDLEPFNRINPCGFSQLQMTQLADYLDLRESTENDITGSSNYLDLKESTENDITGSSNYLDLKESTENDITGSSKIGFTESTEELNLTENLNDSTQDPLLKKMGLRLSDLLLQNLMYNRSILKTG